MAFPEHHRGRLFTPWEIMKDFPAKLFFAFAQMVARYQGQLEAIPNFQKKVAEVFGRYNINVNLISDVETVNLGVEHWPQTLDDFADSCRLAELHGSALFIEKRMKPVLKDGADIPMLPELLRRIEDEMESIVLKQIPTDLAGYYAQPALFGQQVADKFPSANNDIEESGNCIATEVTTAAVFHLMRVLELAMKEIARSLNIPDPVREADRNWGKMLGDKDHQTGIWRELERRRRENAPGWEAQRPFYENVYNDLCAVRTAWRNPVMHVEGSYNLERALHVFNVVKGLMQHLAEHIGESE